MAKVLPDGPGCIDLATLTDITQGTSGQTEVEFLEHPQDLSGCSTDIEQKLGMMGQEAGIVV